MKRLILVLAMVAVPTVSLADEPREQLVDPDQFMQRVLILDKPVATYQSCCKTCRKGKACGDSCISRSKTCRVGNGCACDG
ncbi:hypothetical protein PGB28_15420 [Primorskyibacter aestuariivivens]|uniref:hypothetical protein n=1 Tax=Primorskyibacter aestuariivivens TaxID=1888912 RepID=UPI00230066C6|nr:hypothetical protein [Primorskyibacter aestuariivivens]MDA7429854.1 hypothetical protein [Primorskyibacter aestuariivivens]